MTKDTIVIDLDGTLADVAHRRHLVVGKHRDYKAFHALLGEDTVNQAVAALMIAMNAIHYKIVVVSARPEFYREETLAWLKQHRLDWVIYDLFLLRAEGDNTPSQDLKRAWLKKYGAGKIKFIVEDSGKVVDMWRAEGLVCFQCAVD